MLTKIKKYSKQLILAGKLILALVLVLGVAVLLHFLSQKAPVPELNPNEPVQTSPNTLNFTVDEHGYMACQNREYSTGIDVSEYQREVDWEKVRAAGIEFVFIRIGGRGTTEGGLYADSMAKDHYDGAKGAGLQVGMYFYSQAITPEEAKEEAEYVLSLLNGYRLDLPLVYDWEWGGEDSRTTGMEKELLTEITEIFCKAVSSAGVSPMIYFNESQGLDQLDLERLKDYPFWLALYDGTMDFPYAVDYWQYTPKGKVDGIEGDVDLNIRLFP